MQAIHKRERLVPIYELPGHNTDPKELNTSVYHFRSQQDQIIRGQGYNWEKKIQKKEGM